VGIITKDKIYVVCDLNSTMSTLNHS
jgi:hypothetical protein